VLQRPTGDPPAHPRFLWITLWATRVRTRQTRENIDVALVCSI